MSELKSVSDLRSDFLEGMSRAAATVNIVTTDGAAGRGGVTVSAMSSVSADTPRPTLLACVHHKASAAALIVENGVFCVNVLRDAQAYIADAFAGRFRDQIDEKFDCADWHDTVTGAPRLSDALVSFSCRVTGSDRVGTHHVLFGEVEEIALGAGGLPLVYAHRAYGAPSRIESAATIGAGKAAAGGHFGLGCFHTIAPWLLPEILDSEDLAGLRLVEGDHRRVTAALASGEVEAALIYDFDLSPEFEAEPLIELQPYVLLPEAHPLAKEAKITPAMLSDAPMILLDAPPSGDYFPAILRAAGVEPKVSLRSSSFETVRGLVARGLGYSLLGMRPAAMHSYGGRALITRPLDAIARPSRLVFATRRGSVPSARAERTLWRCRDYFNSAD